jgi:hypothetical protein
MERTEHPSVSLDQFETIRSAQSGEVYRGVSFAPGYFQGY